MKPRLVPFGDAAYRLPLPPGANGRAVLEALRAMPRVVDAVVTERHALFTFDPRGGTPDGLDEAVELAEQAASEPLPALAVRKHVVSVRYDGLDLEEVARATGMSPADVAARHASRTYIVAAVGFLPGFAYLRELDAKLVLPRRSTPRSRISARSVGIAGPYTGIYPFASPGGWNIIATADAFEAFDVRSGAMMSVGDRVLFTQGPS